MEKKVCCNCGMELSDDEGHIYYLSKGTFKITTPDIDAECIGYLIGDKMGDIPIHICEACFGKAHHKDIIKKFLIQLSLTPMHQFLVMTIN